MEDLPDALFQRWYLSRAESTEDEAVYRPAGYPVSKSRVPQPSLELRADGTYVEYRPGPADREVPTEGRWEPAGDRRVEARLEGGRPPLHIDYEEPGVLKVHR